MVDYNQEGIFPVAIAFVSGSPSLIMKGIDLPQGKLFKILAENVRNSREFAVVCSVYQNCSLNNTKL